MPALVSTSEWSPQALDLLNRNVTTLRDDPALFFSHALQVDTLPLVPSELVTGGLWQGERDILEALPKAVAQRRPLYIASGHALGKDFIAGGIPLWWQLTRYPAKTILTGPKAQQVQEITWNELVRHAGRWRTDLPPIGGRLLHGKYEWDAEHFILSMTTAPSEQYLGKLQGYHSPHILIIVTEAQAVEHPIKEQLDSLMASGQALFLAIGNPLVTTGWFAEGLRDTQHNLVLHLDCEDSPNVLEGREVIPGLVSKAWVDEKRREWYEESPTHPLWWSRVKGQLPQSSVDTLFTRAFLEEALGSSINPTEHAGVLGLDPAEFGDDVSAFCQLDAGRFQSMLTTSKHEPTDTAGRAWRMCQAAHGEVIVVDSIGIGSGVASMLREMAGDPSQIVCVNAASRPDDPTSPYANRRAELYGYARDQVKLGHVEPPRDAQTIDELCEIRYFYTGKGKLLLEPKKDVKERLRRSPDRADAWVLAVWGLQQAKRRAVHGRYPNRLRRYLREQPSKTALVG